MMRTDQQALQIFAFRKAFLLRAHKLQLNLRGAKVDALAP
jgi:hypothetical protein